MKKMKKYLLSLLLLAFACSATAQEGLRIDSVFESISEKYGVLIDLGTDVLGRNSKIVRYKSLRSGDGQGILYKLTMEAIMKDMEGGEVLMESKKNGQVVKAQYKLKLRKPEGSPAVPYNEYILFNYKDNVMTVIYVKGAFSAKWLNQELRKLKKLMITIKD